MNNLNILALALISGLATILGVFLGSRGKKSQAQVAFGESFAGAIMIAISLFELAPGAYREIKFTAVWWVLVGILIIWLINVVLPHIHSVKAIENCDNRCLAKMSYLLLIGMILHDFPEGFAIPSSFKTSTDLGLTLVIATFIHNIPEGYVLTVASVKNEGAKFYYKSALLSGISTFLGAGLGVVLIYWFKVLNPIFLALAAGAMIFISVHELLPMSIKNGQAKLVAVGSVSAIALFFMLNIIF